MCQARSTRRSRKTSSLPKAARASRRPASTASSSSPGSCTIRMPRPPPPQLALTMSGKPTSSARRRASAGSGGRAPVAGMTGTPARSATARASTLLPRRSMTRLGGPIHVIPSRTQASASSGFSARNPYPGWIASTPAARATRRISSMPR